MAVTNAWSACRAGCWSRVARDAAWRGIGRIADRDCARPDGAAGGGKWLAAWKRAHCARYSAIDCPCSVHATYAQSGGDKPPHIDRLANRDGATDRDDLADADYGSHRDYTTSPDGYTTIATYASPQVATVAVSVRCAIGQ
jgi:hypothetical protein